jgi:hypothetical protein
MRGEASGQKALRVIVMLICCGVAGFLLWNNLQIAAQNEEAIDNARRPQQPDAAMKKEEEEIGDVEKGIQSMAYASSQAMRVALHAETQSKFPLDVEESLTNNRNPAPIPGEVNQPAPEPDPPMVTVMAVMITDTDKVALVNVDGEQGILMRQGSKFSEGKARITKIDAKGVTFTWMRKSYQVSL